MLLFTAKQSQTCCAFFSLPSRLRLSFENTSVIRWLGEMVCDFLKLTDKIKVLGTVNDVVASTNTNMTQCGFYGIFILFLTITTIFPCKTLFFNFLLSIKVNLVVCIKCLDKF